MEQYWTLCVFKTVLISNFMSFIVKIILFEMQVPKDAIFFKILFLSLISFVLICES